MHRLQVLQRHLAPDHDPALETVPAAARSGGLSNKALDTAWLRRSVQAFEHEVRVKTEAFLTQDSGIWVHNSDQRMAEQRRENVARMRDCAARLGQLTVSTMKANILPIFAYLETVAPWDVSLYVLHAVHYCLFGAAIWHLGSDEQRAEFLPKVDSCEILGSFAMTEAGHGSDVKGIQTTATYDVASQTFDIHTPNEMAQKIWIGNSSGCHYSAVFAQLIVAGKNQGVHCLIVPTRDVATGELLPGVRWKDCGHKMGMNGVDNGRFWFTHVRVPRTNLLTRFGHVSADGVYHTEIASPSRRFAASLAALLGGRLNVAACSTVLARAGLTVAIKYACTRRQFAPGKNKPETLLMDYQSHQRRLLPLLARTYALGYAVSRTVEMYALQRPENIKTLHVLASGLKAACSWNMATTLQTARECCGGQGFAAANRIGIWKSDADVFLTFEGDNTVLLQQVAKELLDSFRANFRSGAGWASLLQGELKTFTRKNPIRARIWTVKHMRSAAFAEHALEYRERRLLKNLTLRLTALMRSYSPAEAWNRSLDIICPLALAHMDRIAHTSLADEVAKCPDAHTRAVLERVRALYALSTIEADMAFFLRYKYFRSFKSDAVCSEVTALCRELRPHCLDLVEGFALSNKLMVNPPIAGDWQAALYYDRP